MHAKLFKCDFYHLSKRYLPNVTKYVHRLTLRKILTFYFLFVHCP